VTAPTVLTASKTSVAPQTGPKNFVPLRPAGATGDDGFDAKRVAMNLAGWAFFDDLVRTQNRQIEENVRMLAGQQHAIFHPILGRWLDPSEWMSAEERQYRARPAFNRLMPWFILTHARATENMPIVSFVPGPDRADAELAEVLDIAVKSLWYETNMEDVHDRLMSWVIAAGRGHLATRIDKNRGPMIAFEGAGLVPLVDINDQPVDDGQGGQAAHYAEQGIRYDAQGNPLTKGRLVAPGSVELVHAGDAHQMRQGKLVVDVLSPLQVRGDWGPAPWWQKRRHWVRSYHAPEEIYSMFGVEIEPDIRGGQASDVGELERLMYGTGFYGSTWGLPESQTTATNTDGYVELTQLWEAPCNYGGLEETDDSPGGRWLVTSRKRVLRDGVRPAKFPFTSNINTFEFIRLPGRNGGTTIQEALNPVQREMNDRNGRIKDHVNLSTSPIGVIDANAGLGVKKFSNRPGQNYSLNRRAGVPAIEFVSPPRLGDDVYKSYGMLGEEFEAIGFTSAAQEQSSPGDSGEKVKEVRFNTDRFLGPTMRRTAGEYGRVYQNWRALLPLIWDLETVISYAGDDNIAQTITVYPEMFEQGSVNVRPDVESMQPEGLEEKRAAVKQSYAEGLLGQIGSPQAITKYWELARMPHLSRLAKPGGVDLTMAEQENGKLLQGTPAALIPVYDWYDDQMHLLVHEKFMKSPEYLKLDDTTKNEFVLHRQAHQFNMQKKLIQGVGQQAALQSAAMQAAGAGAGGGPSGQGQPGQPGGSGSVRPTSPTPPNAGAPGGAMPTAAGASPS
jgi:hypothetical protein